jgi:hypothetical protein
MATCGTELSLGRFSISLLLCSFRTQELIISVDVRPEIARKWKTYHESDNRRQDGSQQYPSHIVRKRLHSPYRCPITNQTVVCPIPPLLSPSIVSLPIVIVLIMVDILICLIVNHPSISWCIVNLVITIT